MRTQNFLVIKMTSRYWDGIGIGQSKVLLINRVFRKLMGESVKEPQKPLILKPLTKKIMAKSENETFLFKQSIVLTL